MAYSRRHGLRSTPLGISSTRACCAQPARRVRCQGCGRPAPSRRRQGGRGRPSPSGVVGHGLVTAAKLNRGQADRVTLDPDDGTIAVARPRWIGQTLKLGEGQDPLGLQSMTQDRLMPLMLPGILELSQKARYFSFHAFLLDEYRSRKLLPANAAGLSRFIKCCEWDLGLAVIRCPRSCGSSPVGARRLRAADGDAGVIRRGESIETPLGGCGLYYRSPMISLGLVARSGIMLGDRPTPVDVLHSASPRASRLAV